MGGSAAEAGVDAAAVVEVFDPGGDPGVDLVVDGEGMPVVVLGCEGGSKGFGHSVIRLFIIEGVGVVCGVGRVVAG